MSSQKTIYHFHSFSRVLLVAGIIIFINILITPMVLRIDLTQGKIYTISKSTKKIVKNLKSPITLKVYISDPEELPEEVISIRQDVLDLVDEFRKISGGNIAVEKINPTGNNKLTEEAYSYGIMPLQGGKIKQTQVDIKQYFAGIAIVYQDTFVTIPGIGDINNLEYEITAAIHKMTRDKVPLIGIVLGHDENLLDDIKEILKKQYEVRDITTTNLEKIPDSYDVLLVSGPKKDFSEKEQYMLDQFVMRGGKLVVLMDGAEINREFLMATPANTSMNSLIEPYGIKVNSDIVLDPVSNLLVPFQIRDQGGFGGRILMGYPPYPIILPKGLNKDSVITEKLPSLTLPFPSSLTINNKNSETKITELVKTTNKSFTIDANNAILAPDQLKSYPVKDQKAHTIAALMTGKITSAFQGKPIPKGDESIKESVKDKEFLSETTSGAVLVIGSNRFIELDSLRLWPENFVLLANALDVMSQGEALVDIRSRGLANRPLNPIDEKTATWIKYGNILASLLLSLVVGGTMYFVRKRSGKKAMERYA